MLPPIDLEEEGSGEAEGLHQQHSRNPSGGARGEVTSSRVPGPPGGTADPGSQPTLTPDEAESLFVAVVEAWSSLRCACTM